MRPWPRPRFPPVIKTMRGAMLCGRSLVTCTIREWIIEVLGGLKRN
jgi:hypothetical protein